MNPKREDDQKRRWREMKVEYSFASFWEGPYTTPEGDVCSVCGGSYPFPGEHSWGIKPDRQVHPKLFICWECIHWLTPIFVKQLQSHSYSIVFDKHPPFARTLGLQETLLMQTSEGTGA